MPMSHLEFLKHQRDRIDALIADEQRKHWSPAESPAAPSSTPIFDAMTPDQKQHCCFMAFDPDNPDVPLD